MFLTAAHEGVSKSIDFERVTEALKRRGNVRLRSSLVAASLWPLRPGTPLPSGRQTATHLPVLFPPRRHKILARCLAWCTHHAADNFFFIPPHADPNLLPCRTRTTRTSRRRTAPVTAVAGTSPRRTHAHSRARPRTPPSRERLNKRLTTSPSPFAPQPRLQLAPRYDPQIRSRPLPPLLPREGRGDRLCQVPIIMWLVWGRRDSV